MMMPFDQKMERRLLAGFVALIGILATLVVAPFVALAAEAEVVNIRFGYYPDKVLVVLDLKASTAFRIETSSDDHIVNLMLGNVKWLTAAKRSLSAMLPLTAYSFHPGGNANEGRLELQASRPVTVVRTDTYPPDRSQPTHRISLELRVKPAQAAAVQALSLIHI